MTLVKNIGKFDKFNLLVKETLSLIEHTGLAQLAVQSSSTSATWTDSAGRLKTRFDELKFNKVNLKLKNTVFEEYINSLPFAVYRTRIMVLSPFDSYSIHTDPTPRIHLPIITHLKTAFLFPSHNYMCHLPADGSIYWTDTRKEHTFVNYSDSCRVHIVSVVMPNE